MTGLPPRTPREAIRGAATQFKKKRLYFGHGTDNALDEAAWLVGHALGVAPEALERHLDRPLDPKARERIAQLVAARIATRKPLAYLLNEAWFAGHKFYIDERAIVPRSLLGEFILDGFAPWLASAPRRALDLCTGSGCIAIALAHRFPQCQVDAVDLSDAALAVTRINIDAHGLDTRVRAIQSDLFAALGGARYDLIVTNPPYVGDRDMRRLPAEYRHEPALALAAGSEGLDIVARILAAAPDYLHAHGSIFAEVGNACRPLRTRFPKVPFAWLETQTGDDSVFMLTTAQLAAHRGVFARFVTQHGV